MTIDQDPVVGGITDDVPPADSDSTVAPFDPTAQIEVDDEGLQIRGLKKSTAGYSLLPLSLLFTLNFVDEFDRIAFAALTPEIRDAFALSDTGITAVAAVTSVFALLVALPIGILADRFSRVKISIAAGFLWGVAAVATGLVWAVPLLYLVRFLSGVGRITNEVVHPSLLSDYYPTRAHPQVYGTHRLANAAAPVAGPIAGLIAGAVSWEAAFFVLAIPTGLALIGAFRLREPHRGQSLDAELAEAQSEKAPVSFAEARKQLFAIGTLKRFYTGAFFFGIGTLQLTQLISLYFENVFDFGPAARGWVQFLLGAGTVFGLIVGSRLAADQVRQRNLPGLAVLVGAAFAPFAVGMIILTASPFPAIALFGAFVIATGNGGWQPAYYSLLGTVAPPRLRSQAYAFGVMIFGAGGLAYILVFSAFGGEEGNYRGLTVAMAVITGIAGLIGWSAHRFVQADAEAAARSLASAQEFARGEGTPILRCRGVDLKYGTVQILFGVDMDVYEGEIIALLGTNGAGKSTILKAISGLAPPCGGQIIFDGEDITYADAVATSGMGIVVVPGGKAVFPTLTVAEHFECGTWLYGDQDRAETEARKQKVLTEFPRLKERWNQLAGNLSGGEQQQLAVGMAFVARPKLLVIDELSLGLAPTIVEQLLRMVREIHAEGTTIILVEQSINVALTIATRAFFMEKGEVRFDGKTEELLERGDILRSVFLEGAGGQGDNASKPSWQIQERDAAALTAAVAEKAGVEPGHPVLSVRGLRKRFGGITATDDVSFDLMPGEILGLIGPNGAGKTTIFDEISGFLKLDGGRIIFRDQDVTGWTPDKRAAFGLGRSFQDARIFSSLTVSENIALGLERHIEIRDHLSPLLGLPAVFDSEMDVRYTVDDLIELMNLGDYRNKFVSELSTGSRRIVDLAMAIAHDPTVLLLDEPSSGIAQKETEALGPLIKRIQREAKCALLIIEHDMPLITGVSDKIIALELGAVVVEGDADTVLNNPQVIEAYLGGDLDIIHRSGNNPDETRVDGTPPPAETLDRTAPPASAPSRRRRGPLVARSRKDRT